MRTVKKPGNRCETGAARPLPPPARLLSALPALLLALVPAAGLRAQAFDFNSGSAQGWTAFGALDPDQPGKVFTSHFVGIWWDGVNYPDLQDPIDKTKGSFALEADAGPGIDNPNGTWWIMQLVSPDLSALEGWQTAGGYSVRLYNAMGTGALWVNLYVRVWDYEQEKYRFFYSGDAQALAGGTWSTQTFSWTGIDTFPRSYTVASVFVDVWGTLKGRYEGRVYLDDVTPTGIPCGGEPGIEVAPIDSPVDMEVTRCRSRRYFVFPQLPTGSPLVLTLTDPIPGDRHALYARWGAKATPSAFDQAEADPSSSVQRLVIPAGRPEPLFVCVAAGTLLEKVGNLRLEIELAALALESFSTPRARFGAGRVGGTALGGGLDEKTAFSLRPVGGGNAYPAGETFVLSPRRAELVFDIARVPVGAYDLIAERGKTVAVLPRAFEVMKSELGRGLEIRLSAPELYRYNREAVLTVEYSNLGDTPLPAPLLEIVAPDGTRMRPGRDAPLRADEVQLIAIDPEGVAGILAPGARGTRAVPFRSTTCRDCELVFEAYLLTPNSQDAIDWPRIPAPKGMSAASWDKALPGLTRLLGDTWAVYAEGLAERASRLSRRGADAASAREAFRFAVREALGIPTGAVLGTLLDGAVSRPHPGRHVLALLGGKVRSSAVTDSRGNFALDWLEPGATYALAVAGLGISPRSVTIPLQDDVLGVRLVTDGTSNTLAPACPDCDPLGLPETPLVPPEALLSRVAEARVQVITSWDPNEKDGPIGPGEEPFIGAEEEIVYRVYFENESTATAPAQRVAIVDVLEGDLDLTTFRMRDFRLGGTTQPAVISMGTDDDLFGGYTGSGSTYGDSGQIEVVQEVDGGTQTVTVDTEYSLDLGTGRIEWIFEMDTSDPLAGFLLPNDELQQGEGYVEFAVKPKPGLPEGTEIENDAAITFDENPEIRTNLWRNVITYGLLPGAPTNPVPPNDTTHPVDTLVAYGWSRPASTDAFDIFIWQEGTPKPALPTAAGLDGPFFNLGLALDEETVYRWQVVARNSRGSTASAIWRFRTLGPPGSFVRGDTTEDGKLDISDPIYLLNNLFLGGPPAACQKTADMNDDARGDISDAIYGLGFLFLGGPAPPAPYPTCGADPTADVLPCVSYAACP